MFDDDAESFQKIARLGREKPADWIEIILGVKLWDMQRQIAESVRDNRETAVRSCHAIGKSFIAARIVLSFLYSRPNSIIISTAPTDRQVRGILWREIRAAHENAAINLGGRVLSQQINVSADWLAIGFKSSDYDADRFQGWHSSTGHVLVVLDEASGISDELEEGIAALMTAEHGRLLRIGNPTDSATAFGRAFKTKGVAKFRVSAFDTPNFTKFGIDIKSIKDGSWKDKIKGPLPYPALVTPEWVSERYQRWGEDSPQWLSRVMAEFPTVGDDSLIPFGWVERAQKKYDDVKWTGEAYLGVDVARYGEDSTVIAERIDDLGIRSIHSLPKQETMATVGAVVKRCRSNDLPVKEIRVDGDGLGAGVVDRLREVIDDIPVVEMRGGRSPDKTQDSGDLFLNQRAQWYWNMRDRLSPEQPTTFALPTTEKLSGQLTSIRWATDSKGKIKMRSKDEMRRRGQKSPDEADAVVMAMADVTEEMEEFAFA